VNYEDKTTFHNWDLTDVPNMNAYSIFINERGLKTLLLKSMKPLAKPFEKWINCIIPQIQASGSYNIESNPEAFTELYNKIYDSYRNATPQHTITVTRASNSYCNTPPNTKMFSFNKYHNRITKLRKTHKDLISVPFKGNPMDVLNKVKQVLEIRGIVSYSTSNKIGVHDRFETILLDTVNQVLIHPFHS
jgi:hypothetical protein